MPTYEYACRSCGEHLEVSQSFKDPALTSCPSCGGDLRKVFGSVGIVLKGSGFYRNDSRGPAPSEAAAGTSDGSSDGSQKEGAGASKDGAKASDPASAKAGPRAGGSGSRDGRGSSSAGPKEATSKEPAAS